MTSVNGAVAGQDAAIDSCYTGGSSFLIDASMIFTPVQIGSPGGCKSKDINILKGLFHAEM